MYLLACLDHIHNSLNALTDSLVTNSKRGHIRESKVLISLSSSLFLSCSLSLLFFLRSKRVLTKERGERERERAYELAAACTR